MKTAISLPDDLFESADVRGWGYREANSTLQPWRSTWPSTEMRMLRADWTRSSQTNQVVSIRRCGPPKLAVWVPLSG